MGNRDALQEARDLLSSGRPSDCLNALAGFDEASMVVRFRALLALGRPACVVAYAKILQPEWVEAQMLYGAALVRSGSLEAGRQILEASPLVESAYHLARSYWMVGDMDAANQQLSLLDSSTGTLRSRVIELRAWAMAKNKRTPEQIELLKEALSSASVINKFHIINSLSMLALERDLTLYPYVVEAEHAVLWTPDFSDLHYQTVRNIGWCAALSGDLKKTLRCFRDSFDVATSEAYRAMSKIDRAKIIADMGYLIVASDVADEACEILDGVESFFGDEREALSMVAEVLPSDPARAAAYLQKYDAQPIDARSIFQYDIQARGYHLDAEIAISLSLGQTEIAKTKLTEAYGIWSQIGCRWRMALAAEKLHDLGDDHTTFLKRVITKEYPQAWFSRRISMKLGRETIATSLQPRDQRILRQLVTGKPHKEIANKMGLSPKYVKTRATLIQRQLGFTTRAELMAALHPRAVYAS